MRKTSPSLVSAPCWSSRRVGRLPTRTRSRYTEEVYLDHVRAGIQNHGRDDGGRSVRYHGGEDVSRSGQIGKEQLRGGVARGIEQCVRQYGDWVLRWRVADPDRPYDVAWPDGSECSSDGYEPQLAGIAGSGGELPCSHRRVGSASDVHSEVVDLQPG